MEVAREDGSVLCRIALWDCFRNAIAFLLGSLSSNVFERRASSGSGLFALMKRDFEQVFGQIVSVKVKTPNNTNLVASKHIKRKKAHFRLTGVNQKRGCLNDLLVREAEVDLVLVQTSSFFK